MSHDKQPQPSSNEMAALPPEPRGELSKLLYALWDFENMSLRSRSDIDTVIRGLVFILASIGFRGQLAIEAVVGIFHSTRIEEEVRYALMSRGIPVFEAGSADPEAADEEINLRIRSWFRRYQAGLVVVLSSDHAYSDTFEMLRANPNMRTLLLYDPATVGTNLEHYQGPSREFRSFFELAASTPRLRDANIDLNGAESLLLQARRAGSPVCPSLSSNIVWAPLIMNTFETLWPIPSSTSQGNMQTPAFHLPDISQAASNEEEEGYDDEEATSTEMEQPAFHLPDISSTSQAASNEEEEGYDDEEATSTEMEQPKAVTNDNEEEEGYDDEEATSMEMEQPKAAKKQRKAAAGFNT